MTARRRSERLLSAGYYVGESDKTFISYKETPVKPFNKRRHGRYNTCTSNYSCTTPSTSCASARSFGSNASVPSTESSSPDKLLGIDSYWGLIPEWNGKFTAQADKNVQLQSPWMGGPVNAPLSGYLSAVADKTGHASANVERFSARRLRYCVSKITAIPGALLSLGMTLMLAYRWWFVATWSVFAAVGALPAKFFLSRDKSKRKAFMSLAFGSFLLGLWCLVVNGPSLAQVLFSAMQKTEQIHEHNAELHLLSRVAALESHMQSPVSQEKLEKLHDCKKLLLRTEEDQNHTPPSLTREEMISVVEDFLNKREAALCHNLKQTLLQQVNDIVDRALKLHSEDRIGLVDYALESAGGWIVSSQCSDTFKTKTVLFTILGVPLLYHSQTPRGIIQPEVYPGNCWAFRGSEGFAVIHLAMQIKPTSFTIDHLPKTLSPTGTINSAPREFAVYVSRGIGG